MARQEKSLAVCLEILQDYTAKDFSLFAVLTTADFYSHNSQFHFFIAQSKRHETVAHHPFMSQ
jgi:hypothetical protein|uniref:hypothetical protein n=1 Tax=Bacteroides uniformis TaxID=820 RepID=UPI004029839D